jgi:hypothetical protein
MGGLLSSPRIVIECDEKLNDSSLTAADYGGARAVPTQVQ